VTAVDTTGSTTENPSDPAAGCLPDIVEPDAIVPPRPTAAAAAAAQVQPSKPTTFQNSFKKLQNRIIK
jgi:hypothetical protein